ncbi:MAG: DNA integrity scanning protein DisA nucleotide-binding domain protein [bacterium]
MKRKNKTQSVGSRHFSFKRLSKLLDRICKEERRVATGVLRSVIELAIEIAREGREGRRIGTMFVVGDEQNVLAYSRPLILDPLQGHGADVKHIDDPNMRETAKELAQLDGAFVISNAGVILSATRHLDAHSQEIDLPLGLGSRHFAAASITRHTDAVSVVVSESAVVRVFDDGQLIAEIIPELWLLQRVGASITEATIAKIKEENAISKNKC